jgi:hypothetical protein
VIKTEYHAEKAGIRRSKVAAWELSNIEDKLNSGHKH